MKVGQANGINGVITTWNLWRFFEVDKILNVRFCAHLQDSCTFLCTGPAHRMTNLRPGDFVDVNPLGNAGWRKGEIVERTNSLDKFNWFTNVQNVIKNVFVGHIWITRMKLHRLLPNSYRARFFLTIVDSQSF